MPKQMIKVVGSSQIAEIGYDAMSMVLRVRFHGSSTVYAYANVPEPIYMGLVSSPSKGSYIHKNIKGKYEATKNDGGDDAAE